VNHLLSNLLNVIYFIPQLLAYCAIDEFHCGLGVCIPESQVCDQVSQCEDSSDEIDCGQYIANLSLLSVN
jgi:hypothetical protein